MSDLPQPLRIMSTLGLHGVMRKLLPAAEVAGFTTNFRFDPTARLLAAITAGEHADIAILTAEAVEELLAAGVLARGTRRDLARSFVGVAVRTGAPTPDISTAQAFRATLLAVPSLAYSRAGASGIFFAQLIEHLGIAAEVNAKARVIPHGFTAELVASGEVALAIQQVSELMAVPGVAVIGPLPPELNTSATFCAAILVGARPQAESFVAWLAAALTPEELRRGGLEPA